IRDPLVTGVQTCALPIYDGKLDMVAVTAFGATVVSMVGLGDGTFMPAMPMPLPAGSFLTSVALDDLDGDGKADAVVARNGADDEIGRASCREGAKGWERA